MKKLLATTIAVGGMFVLSTQVAQAAEQIWANTGHHHGTVNVGWAYRGGTCHVRYTESNQQMYKYRTASNCDAGSVEVGHLTPGVSYKFSVSPDGNNWTHGMTAVAASKTTTVSDTTGHTEKIYEQLPETDLFEAKENRSCDTQGTMQTQGALNHDERKTGKCGTGVANFRTAMGDYSGEIKVYWTPNTVSTGQYHLVYGTESGHYTMGALNIGGKSNSFTIRGLTPGVRYYFKLIPVRNGKAVGSSWEVSELAR